jgi:hypothetical protein
MVEGHAERGDHVTWTEQDERELAATSSRITARALKADTKRNARIAKAGKGKAKSAVWSDDKEASATYKAVAAGLSAALSDALGPCSIDRACGEAAPYLGAVNHDERGRREGKRVRDWWKSAERSCDERIRAAFEAARRGDAFSAALTPTMLAAGGADAVRTALRVLATGRWRYVRQGGGGKQCDPFKPASVEVPVGAASPAIIPDPT